MLGERCRTTRWFQRCLGEAIGVCQYCSRAFCAAHGSTYEAGEQVCHRRLCQEKYVDVGHHRAYREGVRQRNAWQSCGIQACQEPQWGTCSRCQGVFCAQHLRERSVGRGSQRLSVSVCQHCWERRKIWGS